MPKVKKPSRGSTSVPKKAQSDKIGDLAADFLQRAARGDQPKPEEYCYRLTLQEREAFIQQVGVGILLERVMRKRRAARV